MTSSTAESIAPGTLSSPPEAVLEQADAENFPVALRCLPSRIRRHLLALYGFARLADDIGDEAPGDRVALLDELERELDRVYAGKPRHPLTQRLAASVRELSLPKEEFLQLIEANRRDQRVHRYATFAELCNYCALSANPIGRLVLHVFGKATSEREELSDMVCTALQLVEHCQDVTEDLRRGRVYLPGEDLGRFGCREENLRASPTATKVRALVAFEVARARGLLRHGEQLLDGLAGWSWVAVVGFIAGGYAAADACERVGFDVLPGAPRARRRDLVRHALRLALRRPQRRRDGR